MGAPVVFMVFNRPDHTAASFERIRRHRPDELFIVADGPRVGHPTDRARCEAVRDIVSEVDWPCRVRRDMAPANLGLKSRFISGLNWVFGETERAIILEDDCVPTQDFFTFCDALLERHADDSRVSAITGNNFQDGLQRGDASYYFSKYPHVWGWASWQRSWAHYDGDMTFWPSWKGTEHWKELHSDAVERRYWERIFDRCARGEIDTWDYQWTASTWYRGGLTATPNANLVSNIGFGPEATHTKSATDLPGQMTSALGPIRHPVDVERNAIADRHVFEHHFLPGYQGRRDRLKALAARGARTIRRRAGNSSRS